jgi:tetrapyrrole methylase family protein/MazG family protein
MTGVTLVGLGPGALDQITYEAQEILNRATEVWVTASGHPVIAALRDPVKIHVLAESKNASPSEDGGHSAIWAQLIDLEKRPEGVVLALAGHPLLGNTLGAAIWRCAIETGVACRVVSAPSPLDSFISMLPATALTRLSLCTAASLEKSHVPPFPPDAPVLIMGLGTPQAVEVVRTVLQSVYPPQHEVTILPTSPDAQHWRCQLAELRDLDLGYFEACVYVPPLPTGSSMEALQEVIARLRAPEGCPWDREQTHVTLRPHLLEEAYEALAAMDSGSAPELREELGDLLLQIMLNSQIAAEAGDFTLNDVARGIHDKLIRRHPHVFGELHIDDIDGVLSNWERLKEGERAQKGDSSGLLEGVPAALPALSQAQEYQDRAARVGFDWPEITGVLDKIGEEVREVQAASDAVALEAELGDLMFSLVNLSRWRNLDAESALRAANQRFRRRFRDIEASAQRQGRRLSELSLQEMDALWNQAKAAE